MDGRELFKEAGRLARTRTRRVRENKKGNKSKTVSRVRNEALKINLRLKGGRPVTTSDSYEVDSMGRVLVHRTPYSYEQPKISWPKGGWKNIWSDYPLITISANRILRKVRLWMNKFPSKLYYDCDIKKLKELQKALQKAKKFVS
jgi:hypothetical protein